MPFANLFIGQPDYVRRLAWFFVPPGYEAPDGVTAELLSDAFDLAYKFGVVAPDGYTRRAAAVIDGTVISVVSAMPQGERGLFLSVSQPPTPCGIVTFIAFPLAGSDGSGGYVEWDARIMPKDLRQFIRYYDSLMATFGCVDVRSGERYGIFDPAVEARMRLPTSAFFSEEVRMLRLPDGVKVDSVIDRFVPVGSVVGLRLGADFCLCRAQDVRLIREEAHQREKFLVAVLKKYGFRRDELDEVDQRTFSAIATEVESRMDKSRQRKKRRVGKRK